MAWIDVAENLPVGHNDRVDCPDCGVDTNTRAAVVNHTIQYFSVYCYACGFNDFKGKGEQTLAEIARIKKLNEDALHKTFKVELPHDFTTDIPLHGRLWLYSGGLTETVWKSYGVGYSEVLDRVILPVYDTAKELQWFQGRALHAGQTPKYLQPSAPRDRILFKSHSYRVDDDVVIVEDILSAIRVGEVRPAISLLGTKITTGQLETLTEHTRVCTWLDSDSAGRNGSYAIRKAVGLLTETRNIVTDSDPKCLSRQQIQLEIEKVL